MFSRGKLLLKLPLKSPKKAVLWYNPLRSVTRVGCQKPTNKKLFYVNDYADQVSLLTYLSDAVGLCAACLDLVRNLFKYYFKANRCTQGRYSLDENIGTIANIHVNLFVKVVFDSVT